MLGNFIIFRIVALLGENLENTWIFQNSVFRLSKTLLFIPSVYCVAGN